MTLASECPDTAQYLDEFPCDPDLRGGDLVTAITTRRERFADRARVGMSERQLNQSILEREIRQDRADGSMCEPRVVVQRTPSGFRTLGAICKRIDSPIGASVARDYREESLDVSLRRFFGDRFGHARDELFGTADRLREMLVPVLEASGTRVHQFGIDCRLCIDPRTGGAEFPFIEFQFGIGRIDWHPFADYRTPEQLRECFGLEIG